MTATRYTCPVCGRGVTLHVTPRQLPVCWHAGTVHDAKKAARMERTT